MHYVQCGKIVICVTILRIYYVKPPYYTWLDPKSYKPNQLKKEITQKLTDINKQKWLNEVATKSSCRTYRTFKTELNLEKYLSLSDRAERINICKFRCRKIRYQ